MINPNFRLAADSPEPLDEVARSISDAVFRICSATYRVDPGVLNQSHVRNNNVYPASHFHAVTLMYRDEAWLPEGVTQVWLETQRPVSRSTSQYGSSTISWRDETQALWAVSVGPQNAGHVTTLVIYRPPGEGLLDFLDTNNAFTDAAIRYAQELAQAIQPRAETLRTIDS